MPDLAVQLLGPLFGPDRNVIASADPTTKQTYALEIFPDAANPLLRANGFPMQYYFLPEELCLAKKPDGSSDFDFSVTLFKGLMTSEDTLGVAGQQTSGGEVDGGGAFVSFSTTMAVPDSVIADVLNKLKTSQHDAPPARIASYFGGNAGGPDPLLGIVPIADNQVTIEVPHLAGVPAPATPPTGAAAPPAGASTPAATGQLAAGAQGTAASRESSRLERSRANSGPCFHATQQTSIPLRNLRPFHARKRSEDRTDQCLQTVIHSTFQVIQ
jgi:hypothetical protein